MMEVQSKGRLFHMVFRKDDFQDGRVDLIAPDNFLQLSTLKLERGTTFKAHKHVWKEGPELVKAQESWVVIQGTVLAKYYDDNGNDLAEVLLKTGDVSITLHGGHNYVIIEQGTLVYEFKTGPYTGQENDKVFI